MFSFMLARDTMHQNQWLAAIEDLQAEGLEETPVPSAFPQDLEKHEVAYQFMDASEGTESQQGRWAQGASMDGKGEFSWVKAQPFGEDPGVLPADPRLFGTPPSGDDGLRSKTATGIQGS